MVLVLCISSDDALYNFMLLYIYMLYITLNYSRFPIFKFSKGHHSVKNVGNVMGLVLCLLADNALYLYKVS